VAERYPAGLQQGIGEVSFAEDVRPRRPETVAIVNHGELRIEGAGEGSTVVLDLEALEVRVVDSDAQVVAPEVQAAELLLDLLGDAGVDDVIRVLRVDTAQVPHPRHLP
jgi:hypothetical protein